jgi:hypothetical protein
MQSKWDIPEVCRDSPTYQDEEGWDDLLRPVVYAEANGTAQNADFLNNRDDRENVEHVERSRYWERH